MIDQSQVAGKLDEIQKIVGKLTDLTASAAKEGRAVDEVERDLWDGLMQLGATLLGSVFAQLGEGDVGPVIEPEEGKPLQRSAAPKPRRYRSVFGTFELRRYTYAEHAKRAAKRIPFDEHLGLPSHDYSLLLEKWIGAGVCEDSFEQAVSFLEQMLGSRIPVDSAERICSRQAEWVEEFFEQLPTPEPGEEGQILVESLDRKGVPLRRPHRDAPPAFGPTDEKGPKRGTKKMATVGTVYSVDRHLRDADAVLDALFRRRRTEGTGERRRKRPRPQSRRMRAQLPVSADVEEDFPIEPVAAICGWISEEVDARKDHVEELVFLSDGEEFLRETASKFRSASAEATEILDLLHVVPRIWTCAKPLHGDQPLEQFVRSRLRSVLQGRASSVIRGFRRMATLRKLRGEARKTVDDACSYLEQNLSRMHYDDYLSRGLPIATGMIEGACGHLVKDRMERSGMRWTLSGAQSVLALRSVKTSGLSAEYHTYYRSKHLKERYGAHRLNYAEEFQLAV